MTKEEKKMPMLILILIVWKTAQILLFLNYFRLVQEEYMNKLYDSRNLGTNNLVSIPDRDKSLRRALWTMPWNFRFSNMIAMRKNLDDVR